MRTTTIREEINEAWKTFGRVKKTQSNYQKFYHRALIARGIQPIIAAHDDGGNCLFCGECGRCPGWHYKGEELP